MKLELLGLSKSYGSHPVLSEIHLEVTFAHVLALIGPSGGGKSTLLRLIGGLEIPSTGSVRVQNQLLPHDERALRDYRRSIGIVFQAYNLFPHLTALQNIMLSLEKVHGFSPPEAESRAMEVLGRFHLADHARKYPAVLSGGQRQRVAIARAVAHQPRFLLFDEPTSALDPEMSAEVLDLIDELRESGSSIVLVTHEMRFARKAADLVAFLAAGTIVEHGPADAFFSDPQSAIAQRFIATILKY